MLNLQFLKTFMSIQRTPRLVTCTMHRAISSLRVVERSILQLMRENPYIN
jgi:hypothetical protein